MSLNIIMSFTFCTISLQNLKNEVQNSFSEIKFQTKFDKYLAKSLSPVISFANGYFWKTFMQTDNIFILMSY